MLCVVKNNFFYNIICFTFANSINKTAQYGTARLFVLCGITGILDDGMRMFFYFIEFQCLKKLMKRILLLERFYEKTSKRIFCDVTFGENFYFWRKFVFHVKTA